MEVTSTVEIRPPNQCDTYSVRACQGNGARNCLLLSCFSEPATPAHRVRNRHLLHCPWAIT
eukprot:308355-Amphidinium_carterae.1